MLLLEVCNTLAVLLLLYGCEIWILKQRDISGLKTAEMKFMRRRAEYNLLDHRINEDVLEEIEIHTVEKKLAQYEQNLLNHVSRMEDTRYSK
jgi:uncharacterized protein YdcH (DUF465 family)